MKGVHSLFWNNSCYALFCSIHPLAVPSVACFPQSCEKTPTGPKSSLYCFSALPPASGLQMQFHQTLITTKPSSVWSSVSQFFPTNFPLRNFSVIFSPNYPFHEILIPQIYISVFVVQPFEGPCIILIAEALCLPPTPNPQKPIFTSLGAISPLLGMYGLEQFLNLSAIDR